MEQAHPLRDITDFRDLKNIRDVAPCQQIEAQFIPPVSKYGPVAFDLEGQWDINGRQSTMLLMASMKMLVVAVDLRELPGATSISKLRGTSSVLWSILCPKIVIRIGPAIGEQDLKCVGELLP